MTHHVLQAIVTKYIGPSNTRGSRIKAMASAGSITIECDPALNMEANHAAACAALAEKLKWHDQEWLQGGMPTNSDYSYCFVSTDKWQTN